LARPGWARRGLAPRPKRDMGAEANGAGHQHVGRTVPAPHGPIKAANWKVALVVEAGRWRATTGCVRLQPPQRRGDGGLIGRPLAGETNVFMRGPLGDGPGSPPYACMLAQ
jgi:hypothetical protein